MSSLKLIQFLGLATAATALQVSVASDQQSSAAGAFVQISASKTTDMVVATTGVAGGSNTTAEHVVLFAQRFKDFALAVHQSPQDVIERTMVRRTTEISLFKFQKNKL